ncbi:MAG TPA: ATP-binding protein, partial [Campylobacterales bacterium]|nr:ATP-binding protein [Campylobacterales bacterium]
IFDKFYRAGSSSKIKGSGLGLAIAKGIIQAHRGEISASKRHGDFTINIILPINAKENTIDLRKE